MSRTPPESRTIHSSHTFYVVLQHGGSSLLSGVRLLLDSHVDNTTDVTLDDRHSHRSAIFQPITRSVVENASLEHPLSLEPQSVEGQQDNVTTREPVAQPSGPFHNDPSTLEAGDSEEAVQSPADREHGSNKAVRVHSNLKTRIVVLITIALSLVVIPGLVLGIATKQIPWGIALSGAIATVVSFFAGLYYYHNK